ncbi:DUF5818 domain-containing protein [Sphingomonas panacis]|nr:DUF5818 domain-containing protein [Sphingomonas panacis]
MGIPKIFTFGPVMTGGPYRRLTGMLRSSGRSSILETDEGDLIRLASPEELSGFDATRVIVEGHLSGTDLLKLVWIGAATD